MAHNLTPYEDRNCPIYQKVIDGELCYETAMCMQGLFKLSSVPEAVEIALPVDIARAICKECVYGDME